MRKLSMALLIAGLAWLMCGCSASQQPEHQAYAISMSADHADGGKLQIGVTVPISTGGGSGAGSGGSGGGSAEYARLYATTESFSSAMDVLQSTAPYALNLSQLQSIIISRELAESTDFATLLENLMLTNHLYSDTQIIICQDSARRFMENEKPQLGGVLSLELETSYEHYTQQGYVPNSRLSDVYYACASIYGDPLCMLAATVDGASNEIEDGSASSDGVSDSGGSKDAAASSDATLGDVLPQDMPVESPGKNRYLGAALIKNFRMVGELNGTQTRWVKVLKGRLFSFSMIVDDQPMRIQVHGHSKNRVDTSGEAPRISIELSIEVVPQREMPNENHVIEQATREITEMLSLIRELGVDPVQFAEIAAAKFLTVADFERYNWSDRFKSAEFDVQVHIENAYRL